MTSELDESIQHDLEAIRREFESELGNRIAELSSAWEDAKRAGDANVAAHNVALLAHTIAGTSGVLGLVEVGRAASDVEEAIYRMQNGRAHQAVDVALTRLVRTTTSLGSTIEAIQNDR